MEDKKNEKRSTEEILKMLRDIDENEKQLKMRRNILKRQKPWYLNPTNIIGIITILTTITIALYSIMGNSKKKELTCSYSQPKPLTSFSSKIQEDISIHYRNITVPDLAVINITIKNTGTEGLTRNDFADGPIEFNIEHKLLLENDSVNKIQK